MQPIDEITKYLQKNLTKKRFDHTMGVANTADSLAVKWGEDTSLAFLAGLVHDCAKEIPYNEIMDGLCLSGYKLDEIEKCSPALLHAPYGAILAKEVFGIHSAAVLDAVKYHTLGRPNMSLLEKIIYVADFIEPNRGYSEAETLRKLAFEDIDKAVLAASDMVIKFTIERRNVLHPDTVATRNYYLKLTKEGRNNET